MKRHLVCLAVLGVVLGTNAKAQTLEKPLQLASREPAFYAIIGSHLERTEARNVAALRASIALHLHDATIPEALKAIEARTTLRFAFKPAILPPGATVSLDATEITVAAALTQILQDADVDVEIAPYGLTSIVARRAPRGTPSDSSNGTVSGRITDSKNGSAVTYATVSLEGTGHAVASNDSGSFRMLRVRPGTYTITVRRVGYTATQKSIAVVSGQTTTVDFTLAQSVGQLDQVVVTGTVLPAEMKSIPTPITVVSDSEIAAQQPRTVNEVVRQSVPTAVGFDPFATPNASYLTVRGATDLNGAATQLKIFIDGVEVASYVASPVDPQSIDHIEVIRGPEAAAIYGSGAIDGVMQIFTKHGDQTHGRPAVDAQVAAADVQTPYPGFRDVMRQTYSADVRGGTADASYTVGGGYTQTNNYLPLRAYSAQSTPSVYAGVHYNRGISTLDVSGRYFVVDAPNVFNPKLEETEDVYGAFGKPQYLTDEYTNSTIGASLAVQPTSSWRNVFTLGYDENNWNEDQRRAHLSTPSDTELSYTYQMENKISLAYNSSLTERMGSAVTTTFTLGADYWKRSIVGTSSGGVYNVVGEIVTDSTQPFYTNRYLTTNKGVFGQAQVAIFDDLFLTAGLRAEWNTDFGNAIGVPLSPRFGAAYSRPLGFMTLKVRASWGSALLPPRAGTKDLIETPYSVQQANPGLLPERQHGGDGGFDLTFGNVGVLSATYFNQTAVNLIQQVRQHTTSGPAYQFQYQNVGTVTNSGVELEGRVNVWRLTLRAMYGYSRSRVDQLAPGYTGDYMIGDQAVDVPKNTAGASLSLHVLRGTTLSAGLTYVGSWTDYNNVQEYFCFDFEGTPRQASCPAGFLNTGSTRSFLMQYPSLVKGNVSVTQTLNSWLSAFVSIDNIGDDQGYEGSDFNPAVGRISTFGLRVHY